jgi:hypothetical protein
MTMMDPNYAAPAPPAPPAPPQTPRGPLQDLRGLQRAVELGWKRMEPMREARLKFISQYVGPFYGKQTGKEGSDERKASPVNLMFKAISTLVPNLVYREPMAMLTTDTMAFRQYAGMLELAVNHAVRMVKLCATLRDIVTDALFAAGFAKCGIGVSDLTLDLEGRTMDIGAPFVERVDPDDMILDPAAREWKGMSFVGNRFRVPKQDAIAAGVYDPADIERYCEESKAKRNEVASLSGDATVLDAYYGEVAEYIDLCEIYLPTQQLIVTLPWGCECKPDKPLRIVEWQGPKEGPYHMLKFASVPNNVLPIAPASVWSLLHELANKVARKVARQAGRMKSVLAYDGTAVEDAAELADADDGETVRVDNINGIKEVSYGGTNDAAYQFMDWIQTHFSQASGNIDLLAGATADQNTLGQSELLNNNQQIVLKDMQNQVYNFTGELMATLAFYIHTDPLIDLMLTKRVLGEDVQVRYTPEMREGVWLDYNLKTRPYSMAQVDPNVVVRRIMDFISQGIPALAQGAAAFGAGLNVEGAARLILERMGVEEADEIINSPALHQVLAQKTMALLASGVAPDGKAGGPQQQPGPQVPGAPPPGAVRPVQPNPWGTAPVGGVSPQQEQNSQRQQASAGTQSGYDRGGY